MDNNFFAMVLGAKINRYMNKNYPKANKILNYIIFGGIIFIIVFFGVLNYFDIHIL